MAIQFRELLAWARHRKVFATALLALTLGIGIVIGTVISGRVVAGRPQGADGATLLTIPSPVQLSNTFSTIAGRVEPSVVNIRTTSIVQRRGSGQRRRFNTAPDQFQDFFDRFFDRQDQGPAAERSLGSGVIVDKKGFILTNNHVVEQADKIQVKLDNDPKLYAAKVIGSDTETDIAVIKIDAAKDLPVAKLGNSDAVQVGDWVLAFGSPFGLSATVTAGIVSAKERSGLTRQQFQRFIQTDAAINPGNSGGPLVSMAGEVIGINTAIITSGRGNDGVGFALPSNAAVGVYNQLITSGKVTRGSIGISFTEDRSTNPVLLQELGAPYGMVIEDVTAGSPAERAGLQVGDIITEVNGRPVRTGSDLVNPIADTPVGQKVRLTYIRDKKKGEATLTVEDRVKVFPRLAGQNNTPQDGEAAGEFGLRVDEFSAEEARRMGLNRGGVIVLEVEPASFAEELGFEPRDIIVEVNHSPVATMAEYRRSVSQLKAGQHVLFRVQRRVDDRWLTVLHAGVIPAAK